MHTIIWKYIDQKYAPGYKKYYSYKTHLLYKKTRKKSLHIVFLLFILLHNQLLSGLIDVLYIRQLLAHIY